MKRVLSVGSLLGVFCSLAPACESSDTPDHTREAPVPDAGAEIPLSSILATSIDALTPAEAETLCEERARREDYCVRVGRDYGIALMGEPPPADAREKCEASVATCRATEASRAPVPIDCSGARVALKEPCPVTVKDYLDCVDAFNAGVTCETAGFRVLVPEQCKSITATCPALTFDSSGVNPRCPAVEGDAGASDGTPKDPLHDVIGFDGCRPKPARFVVMGDSIAACATDTESCAATLIHDYLDATYAPGITFEHREVAGSQIKDLPGQAAGVEPGPGHLFVWVYAVGNDLLTGNSDYAQMNADWNKVLDRFHDTSLFPDGVTFLVNTQYDPDDGCTSRDALVRAANENLIRPLAESHDDVIGVDQYPDFLGHGTHADDATCGHCLANKERWIAPDGAHASDAGQVHIAEKWKVAIDAMLGDDCDSL